MRWSKLKSSIELNFALSVKKSVKIFYTRYAPTGGGYSTFNIRGWITIDGVEIANFSTPDFCQKYGSNWLLPPPIESRIDRSQRSPENSVEWGEFDASEWTNACREFLQLAITNSFAHSNPLIQALSVLDRRIGKRRLMCISKDELHPLVRKLLDFRLKQESLL